MADRTFAAGRFCFTLDGQTVGFIKKIDGGTIKGEVATHDLGVDNLQKKHLATISHEPLTMEIGMGMGKAMYEWMQASFDKGFVTKNGEVIAADFDYKAMAVRELMDMHIAEITVPTLDGSSKDAAYWTLKVDPERIRYSKGGGQVIQGEVNTATKKWLCSNFRITIGDLPCTRVAKVDSFTWKQSVVKDEVGQFREYTKHAAKVEVPNLKLTISMADWDAWSEWHKSFVIDGKCADSDELTGSIVFMGPDLQEELGSIELDHIGIISMQQVSVTANEDKVARFEVELYIESMKYLHGS